MLSWMEWNANFKESWVPNCTMPNKKERQNLYKEYVKEYRMNSTSTATPSYFTTTPTISWPSISATGCGTYSLGTFGVTPEMYGVKQEEGNNPMNYATATVQAGTTETQDQRKYLAGRLQDVYAEKRDPLEADFGLQDDCPPTTVTELKERLEKGEYTFRTGDQYKYWHWTDLIQWRHPDRKQDHEGFKKAVDELKAERQKALDIIKIDEPKAGLDAIKALEAWEPSKTA